MFLFVERNTLIQQRKGKKNYHCTTVFFSLHKVHILISYVNIICILKKKKGVGFILYEKKEKNTCKRDFSNQPCRKCINSRFLLIQQQKKKKKKNCTKTKVSLLIQLKKNLFN